jgi:hypothetical protein
MSSTFLTNTAVRLFSLILTLLILACTSGGNGTTSSPSTEDDTNASSSEIEWLLYEGQYYAITTDVDNCLDRDYDNHKSIFCGGDDLNDMNSSVNPSGPEICGDGFDN